MAKLDLKPVGQWQTIFLSTLLVHFCKLTTFLYFGLGAKIKSIPDFLPGISTMGCWQDWVGEGRGRKEEARWVELVVLEPNTRSFWNPKQLAVHWFLCPIEGTALSLVIWWKCMQGAAVASETHKNALRAEEGRRRKIPAARVRPRKPSPW